MRSITQIAAIGLMAALFTVSARAEKLVLVAGGDMQQEGLPATQAKLNQPFGVDFNRSGEMFLVELGGGRVLKVDTAGRLTRLAGTGAKGDGGDGGPGPQAIFNAMHSLVVAPDGALLLADTLNNRVRRYDPATGRVTAFAGTGEKGDAGDGGPAAQARFGGIYCVALDPAAKRLYLTDLDNRRIRAVELTSGVVSTVAGNGEKGVPEDGAVAVKAPLVDPRAAIADRKGNVYILERSGHALRVVDPSGKIRTIVGTGKKGAEGDGGDGAAGRPERAQASLPGPGGQRDHRRYRESRHPQVLAQGRKDRAHRRQRPQGHGRHRRAAAGGRVQPAAWRLHELRRHALHRRQQQPPRAADRQMTVALAASGLP